jgi:hypothetical protein
VSFTTTPRPLAAPPTATHRDVRAIAFRVTAAVIVGFILTGPGGVAELTTAVSLAVEPAADRLHLWHHVDIGVYLTVLMVGTLLVATRRPRKGALAVQVALVSVAALAALLAVALPSPGEVLVPLVVVATLLAVSFPQPRRLLQVPAGRTTSPGAMLGAAAVSPFLVVNLWENLTRQLAAADPHAVLGHWAGAAALAAALLVTVWAGTRTGPTARGLRLVASVTLLVLGVVAPFLGTYAGAWPLWGAISALFAGGSLAWSTLVAGAEVRS